MRENQSNLTPKQEKAIVALLTQPSMKQVSEVSGVSESTLYRWMQEEEFGQAFKEARKQAFSQSITRLQQASSVAADTLIEIMNDKKAPASSRVTASRTVFEMAHKAYEIENVTAKLEELERTLEEQEQK